MNNILRLSIVLTIITLIAAFVLAEIYKITKPRIELQKLAKTQEALAIVLPEAKLLVPVNKKSPVKDSDGNVLYEKEEVLYYKGYAKMDTTHLTGYAFKASGSGYSSIVETMVGIDTTGHIKMIKIISQKETPGLGALSVNSEPFNGKKWSTLQFIGKGINDLKVDKDGGPIVSITGATITSRAITNSIKDKLTTLLPELKIASAANPEVN
jgi:electron transport complex protein RnfG